MIVDLKKSGRKGVEDENKPEKSPLSGLLRLLLGLLILDVAIQKGLKLRF